MKLGILLLLFTSVIYADDLYRYRITRVIDGDTFEFIVPDFPNKLKVLKLRVRGIDSGEMGSRSHCVAENQAGKAATKYAKQLIQDASDVAITIDGWDKYGGRVVGDLIINGRSYREIMIEKKLVKVYDGRKKQSWCP